MGFRAAVAIGLALVTAACGSVGQKTVTSTSTPSTSATTSASPSATPTLSPSAGSVSSLGILIAFSGGTGPQSAGYDLALVTVDGTVAAKAHAAARAFVHTPGNGPGAAAIDLPEVSTSSTRVYYLDGDHDVRFLRPGGSGGLATKVPGTTTAHAAFAVTPDDRRIAVSVLDYATSPPTLHLFVEDLGGGNHAEIFTSKSVWVWPVGWRQGRLVLAATSAAPFTQQGLVFNPYDAPEYHVVDAVTANRLATIGNGDYQTGCQPLGLLTAAGTACYHRTATAGGAGYFSTLDWTGKLGSLRVPTDNWGIAGLSPNGTSLARCCSSNGTASIDTFETRVQGSPQDWPCFIDDGNVLFGFLYPGPNQHPQIVNARRNMVGEAAIQVPSSGFCAGVFPAALE